MKKNSIKNNRINGEFQKEIGLIIQNGIKDPRISGMTSVVDAEVTPDLKYCTVYISVLGDQESLDSTMEGLKAAAGFIRRELAHRINLRYTPELIFKSDASIEYGVTMTHLIEDVIEADQQKKAEADARITKTIDDLIKEAKDRVPFGALTVGICGHVRPDGDCIGTCMGLYHYLKQFEGIKLRVYLDHFKDQFLNVIPESDAILSEYDGEHLDVLFVLDCSSVNDHRVGIIDDPLNAADYLICIDHHVSNEGFADFDHIRPDASSASEVLFELLDPEKINANVAQCLMTGVVHDTGVFKHSNTSAKTLEVASVLKAKGADLSQIVNETYFMKSFVQNRISGVAYAKAELFAGGRGIISALTEEDMKKEGATPTDLDGIVDVLRSTEGVECAVFLYQLPGDTEEYKVSLRSNHELDVSVIAASYGGGGHVRAAGFSLKKGLEEAFVEVVRVINEALD
ncbi:MAG: 30S ribosome-binding factor RbfA [Lachnospiraceae bacterium]|nr:30S ribosome-binding factor RbfA [Lachnospiraceae bacterium]